MKDNLRFHAEHIFAQTVAATTATLEEGKSVNYEILAALSIEAAMEFEHKCQQEKDYGTVSRVVLLKRAHREGVGAFMRGEPMPIGDGADPLDEERANGWRWMQSKDAERKNSAH